MRKLTLILCVAAALLVAGASAQAALTVNLKFVNVSPYDTVGVSMPGYGNLNVEAGVYHWTDGATTYDTFCVQNVATSGSWTTFTLTPLESAPTVNATEAGKLKQLWAWAIDSGKDFSTAGDAAKMQLAVWQLALGDLGFAINTSAYNTAVNGAGGWLDQASTFGGYEGVTALVGNNQDQIILGGSGVFGVPLPSAVWAGLALMGGGGLVRFRRRRA